MFIDDDCTQVKLDESQNKRFDVDYVGAKSFTALCDLISKHAAQMNRVADFGGGNGHFLDRVLERFPQALGDNYEISDYLRSQNTENPRKKIIGQSVLNINTTCEYDTVFLNWVLHHMVSTNLRQTKELIRNTLLTAEKSLRVGGLLIITENIVQSVFCGNLSSKMLFLIGKSRFLKPFTAKLGANTAGTGVYYMREEELLKMVPASFVMISKLEGGEHNYGHKVKLIGISGVREYFYVFKKSSN